MGCDDAARGCPEMMIMLMMLIEEGRECPEMTVEEMMMMMAVGAARSLLQRVRWSLQGPEEGGRGRCVASQEGSDDDSMKGTRILNNYQRLGVDNN